jgi:hypothetical protein
MGVLHRGSTGGPPPGIACLSDDAKSQDARVRTSPETGGAGAVVRGSVVWIRRAALRGSAVRLCVDLSCGSDDPGLMVRHFELGPVSQTGMIEALTMHRQYSPQENFRFSTRKFLASDGPDGKPPLPPSSNAVASTPGGGRPECADAGHSASLLSPDTGEWRAVSARSGAVPVGSTACQAHSAGGGAARDDHRLGVRVAEALFVDRSVTGLDRRAPHS